MRCVLNVLCMLCMLCVLRMLRLRVRVHVRIIVFACVCMRVFICGRTLGEYMIVCVCLINYNN